LFQEIAMRAAGPVAQEMAAFADRVFNLIHSAQPVRIYTGCGTTPAAGFINLDIAPMLPPADARFDDREYFFFPFADVSWPIPGGWHRVSTPCLIQSMRRHSHFEAGLRGVYIGEWDRWGHQCLFTRHSLEETAKLVGYREVLFNQKNQGASPFRGIDLRPWDDRDALFGNIHADLLK
jgi:hypothetical protein